MSIIEVKNVSKSFGPKLALDKVSLEIPEGEIFGLLGPNGAGKSTLIRIINRITIASEGQVLFKGHPISEQDVARIGYLPEERGLYRKMKVGDQAMYLAQLKGMSAREAATELKKWFLRFDIADWWNKKVEELSKGMAQKVQFITTVVHRPSLMILDEPFSGFDPVNADLIRKEILRLKDEGATIILSTHDMESVEELCDSIALINNARLVVCGRTEEIRRQHGEDNVEIEYTTDTLERRTIIVSRSESAEKLQEFINEGVRINAFKEMIPRMRDIFVKLVTEEA